MKDIWLLIIGDMSVAYQWVGAIVGLVLAVLLLAVGRSGITGPPLPIKHGFTEDVFSIPGAAVVAQIDWHLGVVTNIVFWLVAGPLIGYVTAVTIYLTWPWCIVVAAVLASVAKLIQIWWRRRDAQE